MNIKLNTENIINLFVLCGYVGSRTILRDEEATKWIVDKMVEEIVDKERGRQRGDNSVEVLVFTIMKALGVDAKISEIIDTATFLEAESARIHAPRKRGDKSESQDPDQFIYDRFLSMFYTPMVKNQE